jgi:hypothetical protein
MTTKKGLPFSIFSRPRVESKTKKQKGSKSNEVAGSSVDFMKDIGWLDKRQEQASQKQLPRASAIPSKSSQFKSGAVQKFQAFDYEKQISSSTLNTGHTETDRSTSYFNPYSDTVYN